MRHTVTFLLLLLLVISGMATAGCGSRIAASVQSVSEPVVPSGVTWAAVPGTGMLSDDPSTQLLVEQTAASLATVLTSYDWKWISNPAQAEHADVLVRIRWNTSRPQYIQEFVPVPRYGLGIGTGWRYRPYGPFYGGYVEPRIHTIYTRSLTVEALRADMLSPEVKAAILSHTATGAEESVSQIPSMNASISQDDPSKPPYAPPLRLDDTSDTAGKVSKKAQQGPYAPPILASDQAGIPPEALVWRVEVSSGGSRPNTQQILPQLAAAAAQAVGKTMQTDVFVDNELRVTYSIP